MRPLSIVLIFLGEALAIYAEVAGAYGHTANGQSLMTAFMRMFPIMTVAGVCLVLGYILGARTFSNIWIVGVISITSILLLEPVLSYGIFRQLPTMGAGIGFALGAVGLLLALFL